MTSRAIALLASIALVAATTPPSAHGQTSAPPPPAGAIPRFNPDPTWARIDVTDEQ
ncbi:MAG TPA: hypothetical protein VFE12_05360 [Acetobacteraceae bacterium]|jgi:hypothetical protein|nr:hypothetical protein [Acetobacteraceae bacterium]